MKDRDTRRLTQIENLGIQDLAVLSLLFYRWSVSTTLVIYIRVYILRVGSRCYSQGDRKDPWEGFDDELRDSS